jgi:chitosanase
VPDNPLAPYLPALEALDRNERKPDDTSQLQGLEAAWGRAAKDARFRQVQDEVVERTYFLPAMAQADRVGLKTALGRAIFYDTIIQHGNGTDPDGLPALIARTNAKAPGADEPKWLAAFLAERRADLAFAHDPATRPVWQVSVGRVDALASILRAGNLDLHGPIRLKAGGYDVTIP